MSQNSRKIAGAIVAAVVVIGVIIFALSGGDDPADVVASERSTTTTSASTTSASTTSTSTTSTSATSAPQATPAPTETTAEEAADEPAPPPTGGSQQDPAATDGEQAKAAQALVDLQVASWQFNVPIADVTARLQKAADSEDLCTQLVALSSTPDITLFPELSKEQFEEYFAQWFATADRTRPMLDDQLASQLDATRGIIEFVQRTVDDSGGTVDDQAAQTLIAAQDTELPKLLPFFQSVAAQCPGP